MNTASAQSGVLVAVLLICQLSTRLLAQDLGVCAAQLDSAPVRRSTVQAVNACRDFLDAEARAVDMIIGAHKEPA
jgi:hypothetical protein